MKNVDYQNLVNDKFLSMYDGSIKWYFSPDERPYNYSDVNNLLCNDLDINDINDIIILFPLNTNCGTTMLFKNREIVVDHCTYFLRICVILNELGIKFKNGDSLRDDKYCQKGFSQLIIKDGIASISTNSANPLSTPYGSDNYNDIHITKEEHSKLDWSKTEIMFSGFFLHMFE